MEKYRFDPIEFRLMEQSSIPLAIYQFVDQRVAVLVLSEGFCRLFGYERAQAYYLMDHDMYADTHPDDVARIADAAYRFATEGGKYNVVYRTRTKEGYRVIHAFGEHKYVQPGVRIAVVWYNNEGLYRPAAANDGAFSLDLDYSAALHKESMYRNNSYDALTGLPNLSYFFILAQAGVERMHREGRQPAVVFFDLNGMRYYNGQHGFSEGDKLIADFARLLTTHFSNENCGRFGADHFTVYADEEDLDHKLRVIIQQAVQLNDGISLPVRAGVYSYRLGDVALSVACDRAKYACDTNHSFVSGIYYFDETMRKSVGRKRYIIQNLDRAIQERWIQVYYQPIIRAANGRVCDEEALCRWIDPTEGLLSPAELIPVLEEAKLAYKLDLCVLEQVLEKMQRQKEEGLYLVPQSVNLSRTDFDVCDIVEEIRKRVDAAGIPRSKLTVELTESAVASDFAFMKTQIERLRSLSFCVWMDDFGSGYSTLDVLQSIHFDLIKLDMRLMQQFHEGENARIILTQLTRMISALGIETVAEGVETREQVEFLRDIGCTKLQGYFYCKPIPLEGIIDRYHKGIQIGFENPDESDYYAALGRINLYDLALMTAENSEQMQRLFDTIPMAVLEADDTRFRFLRGNNTYREKLEPVVPFLELGRITPFSELESGTGSTFASAVQQCREEGKRVFFDEELPDGSTVHVLIRHVAVNPITKVYACALVMLGISDASERRVTYTSIAQALSADYIFLYYVNLDTTRFIEYKAKPDREELGVERHGVRFFRAAREAASTALYSEDVEPFLEAFTKEKILRSIDENGAFTLTYRLLIDGSPCYVSLKAVRIGADSKHIIIGVNNVDAQMRQQEAIELARRERIAFNRIAALSGDYLCIYNIDPETNRYSVCSATKDFAALPIPRQGDDFFTESRKNCEIAVHPDDKAAFLAAITKENILRQIRENGLFSFVHRLLLGSRPRYVRVRAALVEEQGRQQLILGLNDIDREINR